MNTIILKLPFFFWLFLFLPDIAVSQSQKIDSLRQALPYSENAQLKADSSTVNILNKIGTAYRFTELDSTMYYAKLASVTAEEVKYTKGLLYAHYLIATVHFNRGEYQQAFEVASSSLTEAGADAFREERALLNQLIGISYASQGSYQPGLEHFFEARNLFEELGNENGVFQNLNNIGVSYLKLENYDRALEIFLELNSLKTLEPATISIPVNLGFIYYELGQFDKAEEQLERVLNFDGGTFDQRAIGLSTFKLGEIYLLKKEYSTALQYFKRSIEVYDVLENELEKVQSLNGIALTYLQMGNLEQALNFAERAFQIAEKLNGLPQKSTSSETLYKIHKERGDVKNALAFHEKFKAFSDSLNNNEISREVGRLEAEYQFKDRELAIREAQREKNLRTSEQISNRNMLIILTLSLLVIAVLVAYGQNRNSALRKKANKLLYEKNTQIEDQAKRLKEMNEIKTQLFSIISHDLRGPLSSLYGFITLTEMNQLSKKQIQDLIPELADKFKYTSTLLNNLLNWARSQLDGYKVAPEQFNLSTQFSENQKIQSYQASNKNIDIQNKLTPEISVYADKNMIGLVILNLLSNAIKFTPENGVIKVWSEIKGDIVRFCIQDNGVGISGKQLDMLFDETSFYTTDGTNDEKGTGLGLMLCKDFISKNKGRIWAESEVGKGSTFCFTLPANVDRFHSS
ncbi:MAG: tetratricopeptide repeat protein [Gracilimonas sp.]|uniref:ATP-binding protein n=1 Tax=Gracilimonas sp. TaxID=1974203 RepID=UPI00199F60EF|nr:tetratricopeptide repeat protein [Gracilimonas sp.]MBD3615296.1 tetratricopeptide repeat protein [Gracilimonas sp.]